MYLDAQTLTNQWYGTGISVRHWSQATAIRSILCSLPLYSSYLLLIANRLPKSLFSPKSRHGTDMVSYALCQPPLSSAVGPPLAHQLHTAKSIPFLERLEGSILYLTLISAATAHDIYHIRPVSISTTLNLVQTPWKQPTSHSIASNLSLLLWQCLFQDNCCVVETKSTQIVYMGAPFAAVNYCGGIQGL